MRFEAMLARKYISAQKRHSALTICSIIVAVTLMSMLFTGYATMNKCLRAASYELQPYHMCVTGLTNEQFDKMSKLDTVESYNKTKLPDGGYQLELMFKKNSVKDMEAYLQNVMLKDLGMKVQDYPGWKDGNVIMNRSLMRYDFVDDEAKKSNLQVLALFYVFIVFIALALRLIIDTAFEISSKERERQFGVLQSVGATPKQIVRIMTMEGLYLSIVGIPVGLLTGIGVAYIAFRRILSSGIADAYFTSEKAEELVRFHVSIPLLILAGVTGLVWVLLSAYGTGMRVIKKSPVEAISARSNTVKKVRRHTLMGLLFGWIGKLSSRNARRQPKRFIVTILSLMISLALFAGVGSAMNYIADFEEAALSMYIPADLEINCDYDVFDPLSYTKYARKLEDSGYFSKSYFSVTKAAQPVDSKKSNTYYITYLSRDEYEKDFFNKPPVSYDELAKSGGYILNTGDEEPDTSLDSLTLSVGKMYASDKVKEECLKEAEGRQKKVTVDHDYTEVEYASPKYFEVVKKINAESEDSLTSEDHTFKIIHSCKQPVDEDALMPTDIMSMREGKTLIATIDQYEAGEYEMYGNVGIPAMIELDIKDPKQHKQVLKYFDNAEDMNVMIDCFEMTQQLRSTTAAYSIAASFVTGLIALIAVVNMINIVSTGIINRKSELASMQCFGMTRGQLYKMAFIESLQYTLFSAIGAIILCSVMVFLTRKLFTLTEILTADSVARLVGYSEPIMRVCAATLFAFVVSMLSAIIPLRLMRKTPLVDQIRSVE